MTTNFINPFPLFETVLPSGMHVTVVHRKGFKRMSAQLAFPFGSLHQKLQNAQGDFLDIPAGTAHFLEHQMFKQEDGTAISDAFAALGAYDNAFTNFDHTVYMADCSENQAEVLKLLLQYTNQPYFETESVENEKDIIVQELMMYRDQPEERLEIHLRQGLYGAHPAGEDIGGSEESVRSVTPEILYACYDAFYRPSLARLVVVGDLTPEEVCELAGTWGKRQMLGYQPIWPNSATEAGPVNEFSLKARAARPLLSMGFGDYRKQVRTGRELLKRQLEMDVLLDLVLGRSSAFYWQLMEQQLFDSSFHVDYHSTPTFGAVLIGGDSIKPTVLKDRVLSYLSSAEGEACVDAEGVSRMKKKTLGELVSAFENNEELAINLVTAGLYGYRFTDIPETLQEISEADLIQRYREFFTGRTPVLSYVYPEDSNKENDAENKEFNE